jgi:hypothetical protein
MRTASTMGAYSYFRRINALFQTVKQQCDTNLAAVRESIIASEAWSQPYVGLKHTPHLRIDLWISALHLAIKERSRQSRWLVFEAQSCNQGMRSILSVSGACPQCIPVLRSQDNE